MGIEVAGLGSLILLGLNIWAFISIISSSEGTGAKVLWCLLVLVLPLLGFIIWFFAGPRARTRAA
ncbi:PLDc N-terminal domain-containing protein [Cognatishimia sp. MH4019]|uniref:PLDc N-terminal domain-containing protein n=1 Tax=Cognatishimia sp. MH4019 TaxID=2854030 RepID=UPI001CD761BA|nr:PLDc N-terminal domain-containing protein [Cognatishimia sp. MH4019]